MKQIIFINLICLPIFASAPSFKKEPVKETHGERLIKRAGLPDNFYWSDKNRMIYGKQIEKVIREMK
jgi:hypothetical protein